MNTPGTDAHPRLTLALAWTALVAIEILTQLSIKFAGRATGEFDFSAHAFALAFHSGWLWVAIASYCVQFFAWMVILARLDLSRAYPASAVIFVAMMLTSWLALHESVGTTQWIGAAIIVAGILQLGRADPSTDAAHTPPITTE